MTPSAYLMSASRSHRPLHIMRGYHDFLGGRVLAMRTNADRCGMGEISIHNAPVCGSCFISADNGKNIYYHNCQFILNDAGTFTRIYKILQYS